MHESYTVFAERERVERRAMTELVELLVQDAEAWHAWLDSHHADHPGVWLVLHKKGGQTTTLTYAQALDEALCFGWIDGQIGRRDDDSYRQRFTPRRPNSAWSARNVEHVARLTEAGRMRPAGIAAVDAAKAQGRWQAAYRGQADMQIPPDLARGAGGRSRRGRDVRSVGRRQPFLHRLPTQRRQAPGDPGPQAGRVRRHARPRRIPPRPQTPEGPSVTFPPNAEGTPRPGACDIAAGPLPVPACQTGFPPTEPWRIP